MKLHLTILSFIVTIIISSDFVSINHQDDALKYLKVTEPKITKNKDNGLTYFQLFVKNVGNKSIRFTYRVHNLTTGDIGKEKTANVKPNSKRGVSRGQEKYLKNTHIEILSANFLAIDW